MLVPLFGICSLSGRYSLPFGSLFRPSCASSRFAVSRSKHSNERFACSHLEIACRLSLLVGLGGLEPPTSRLSGVRSNRLSYKPIIPDQVQTLAPAPLDGRSLRRLRALLDPSQEAVPFGSLSRLSRPLRFPPAVSNGRAIASRLSLVVEINGIEPLTSCLQGRRSPS